MILADKIIYLRKRTGWSQEELADKLGVSRQAVSKWESAQTLPDTDKILQLSRVFAVSTDYLMKDEIDGDEWAKEVTNPYAVVSPEEVNVFLQVTDNICKAAEQVLIGKPDVIRKAFTAILAGGHILLEDIPGVGKTTLALAFSKLLSLEYGRIQFTPDVLPSDITGYSIYEKESGTMRYQKGAVLCNLFLADELNRATSRTQSALLEAMEEGQVTVDGITHRLPTPFTVIATQNPTGAAGTQLLPDSQMDRFMIRLTIGYPSPDAEVEMLRSRRKGNPLDELTPIITAEQLSVMQRAVNRVYADESILQYVVKLVDATRRHPKLQRGVSPRTSLALVSMAKANALMQGRDYVVPRDINGVFHDVVAHRLLPIDESRRSGDDLHDVTGEILDQVSVPNIR